MNFLDKCAKIASLSTCVLNTNSDKNDSEVEIQLTENFKIQTSYNFSYFDNIGDMIGPGPLEVHSFSVKFFRDGNFLDNTSLGMLSDTPGYGSLCDSNLDLSVKLESLKNVKPDIFERFRFMVNKMNLSNEEFVAFEQKCSELETIVNGMTQNKGVVR